MPRHPSPKLLRDLCLNYMAKVLEQITNIERKKVSECDENNLYQSVIDVFSLLPSTILEDLIYLLHLQQPSGIDCTQLEILLSGNVRRLWLHYQDFKHLRNIPLGFQRILKSIGSSGSLITDLSLKGCVLWNNDELIHTIHELKNLKRLVLHSNIMDKFFHSSIINDEVLLAVGISCKFIEDVSFSGWSITDHGLKGLVQIGENSLPPPLKNINLESDRYCMPKVTKHGVIYLLHNLPNLEFLKIPHLIDALLVLIDESQNLKNPMTLLLKVLQDDLQGEPYTADFIDSVVKLCPHIRDMRLSVSDKESLLALKKLKHLSALAVTNLHWNTGEIFFNGMLPLLKIIGSCITRLELCMTEIDLTVVDLCCPALIEFECTKVKFFRKTHRSRKKPFANLKNLKLFPEEVNNIHADDLLFLLSNCKHLNILFLGWCEALSDHTLIEILKRNILTEIKEIEISDITSITAKGLQHLLLIDNDLLKLNILSCDSISREDIFILRNLAKQSNLNIEIKFYE